MIDSSELKSPKIEFPCFGYHIAVVADTHDGFIIILEEIICRYSADYNPATLRVTSSKNGKYQSYRFAITAESEDQLKRLHDDLKATGQVHMVL